MNTHYKLKKVRELANGDEDFVVALVEAFLEEVPQDAEGLKKAVSEKDYYEAYQAAHKMKPTIKLFGLSIYEQLIEVQDWGKFKQQDKNITQQLQNVITAIEHTVEELRKDFGL